MILHVLDKLIQANIKDIMVVTGVEHAGSIINLLGSGREFGCKLSYRVQDEAGGIAQALGLCESFVGTDHCCVILGDNIFTAPLAPFADIFRKQTEGAMLLLKKVEDPGRYGVAELSLDETKIASIVEKPEHPKTDLAVTGIYFYDSYVFNVIKILKPSKRGELEITDVNNDYIKSSEMCWRELPGEWTDAGTFSSLQKANEIMSDENISKRMNKPDKNNEDAHIAYVNVKDMGIEHH